MYNVKISEYLDSTEVVFYDTPICGHHKKNDSFLIERDGELHEIEYDFIFDPVQKNTKTEKSKKEAEFRSLYVSFNRTKNKIYNYARDNKWDWFITFTFNPEIIDSFDYNQVVECMSHFFLFLRHNSRTNTQYLIVPEKHKSGRYHLHGVFTDIDMDFWKFQFSNHYTKSGAPIFNVGGFPYGFTTATHVMSSTRVSHYIAKYITKDMFSFIKNKKRYWCSRNLNSGTHKTMLITREELEILLNSFGEVQSMKKLDTPYNSMTYYQF